MSGDEVDIDESLVRLHGEASQYSVEVNAAIAAQLNGRHPYPLAGGALYRLGAATVAFHQAVHVLCVTGWVFCSAPLLRTLLDLLLSTLIIVERADEAELRGFRCTHFFLRAMLSRSDSSEASRKDNRQQIEAGLAHLSDGDREQGRRFIFSDPFPGYWYAPKPYGRPQEAADKLLSKEMSRYYSTLSSAAHGGLFGLALFQDQPDVIHPNPRNDPRSQTLVLCTSIRIVLEQARARDQFELSGQLAGIYESLVARLVQVPRPDLKGR